MTQNNTYVSAREVPWMKLGKVTDDHLTVEQAVVEAGLDFTVSARPIQFQTASGWKTADKRVAITRDSNDELFEVVSADKYEIFQYAQAFEFIASVNPKIAAAGSMYGGRQGFIAVQVPDVSPVLLPGIDPHDFYAIIRTSHNRTRAIEVSLMPVRGKCMNQLTLHTFAMKAEQRWSITHSKSAKAKLHDAQTVIANMREYAVEFEASVKTMIDTPVSADEGRTIVNKIVRESPKHDETVDKILGLWKQDPAIIDYQDNGWGLVNAVSSYMDWERTGGNPTSRFTGSLSGSTRMAIEKTANNVLRLASTR